MPLTANSFGIIDVYILKYRCNAFQNTVPTCSIMRFVASGEIFRKIKA